MNDNNRIRWSHRLLCLWFGVSPVLKSRDKVVDDDFFLASRLVLVRTVPVQIRTDYRQGLSLPVPVPLYQYQRMFRAILSSETCSFSLPRSQLQYQSREITLSSSTSTTSSYSSGSTTSRYCSVYEYSTRMIRTRSRQYRTSTTIQSQKAANVVRVDLTTAVLLSVSIENYTSNSLHGRVVPVLLHDIAAGDCHYYDGTRTWPGGLFLVRQQKTTNSPLIHSLRSVTYPTMISPLLVGQQSCIHHFLNSLAVVHGNP